MADLLTVDDLRECVETDLDATPLQRILDAADAEIVDLAGPMDLVPTQLDSLGVLETVDAFNARIARETARRTAVLIEVCRLAIQYDGNIRATHGDVSEDRAAYVAERSALISQLFPVAQVA